MNSVVSARWGRGAVGSASRCNREGRSRQTVGPWRSWERASMASRRSWVRIPSAPPPFHRMSFHVYILLSETTNRYYVGQTQDVEERLAYHNANYSKSLRNRGPWRLVHEEEYKTRAQAMRRERQIKSWKDRAMIERLVSASR